MKLRLLALLTSLALFGLASCKDRLPSQPPTNVPSDTLAYWPFDGNLKDMTGNGHDGTFGTGFLADRFGNANSAAFFYPSMRPEPIQVIVNNTTGLNFTGSDSYTISAWMKTAFGISDANIVSKTPTVGSNPGYILGMRGGVPIAQITDASGSGSFTLNGHTIINDTMWHFLTLVVTAHAGAAIYVDSALDNYSPDPTMSPELNNSAPLNIGQKFLGELDEVLIYHRALDLSEIQMRFHEGGWYAHHDTVVVPPKPVGWQKAVIPTSENILGICFPLTDAVPNSGDIGYACGTNGTILKTTDSGATWTKLHSGTSQNLYRISFRDAHWGIVGGDAGTLLITSDGGAVWTPITAPFQTLNGQVENIRDIKFLDQTHAVMVGGVGNVTNPPSQGFVMVSSDAGTTWTRVKECPISIYSIGTDCGRGYQGESWGYFHVVGALGQIYLTKDGGMTWSDESIQGQDFLATDFYNSQMGIAVSASGGIYFTPDGVNWDPQSSGVTSALRTVYMVSNSDEVWAAGDNGIVLHSLHNGSSWTRADINGVSVQWNDIVARDPHMLALIGANGTLYWYRH